MNNLFMIPLIIFILKQGKLNGYIVYYDLDQKKFIYKKYSKMDEFELAKARDYCIDQINSKKGGNYEVKKYSE